MLRHHALKSLRRVAENVRVKLFAQFESPFSLTGKSVQREVFTDSTFSVESISFDPVFDQPGEILLLRRRVVISEFSNLRAEGGVVLKVPFQQEINPLISLGQFWPWWPGGSWLPFFGEWERFGYWGLFSRNCFQKGPHKQRRGKTSNDDRVSENLYVTSALRRVIDLRPENEKKFPAGLQSHCQGHYKPFETGDLKP